MNINKKNFFLVIALILFNQIQSQDNPQSFKSFIKRIFNTNNNSNNHPKEAPLLSPEKINNILKEKYTQTLMSNICMADPQDFELLKACAISAFLSPQKLNSQDQAQKFFNEYSTLINFAKEKDLGYQHEFTPYVVANIFINSPFIPKDTDTCSFLTLIARYASTQELKYYLTKDLNPNGILYNSPLEPLVNDAYWAPNGKELSECLEKIKLLLLFNASPTMSNVKIHTNILNKNLALLIRSLNTAEKSPTILSNCIKTILVFENFYHENNVPTNLLGLGIERYKYTGKEKQKLLDETIPACVFKHPETKKICAILSNIINQTDESFFS